MPETPPKALALIAMLAELNNFHPHDSDRKFLLDRGWVPFGRNSVTGLDGWGKLIGGKSVVVDQPEALALERTNA